MNEAILELLRDHERLTTRRITDLLVARGYAGATTDRTHHRLVAMLLRGQVRRKKFQGVWVWSPA
jgi:hypothetical protein